MKKIFCAILILFIFALAANFILPADFSFLIKKASAQDATPVSDEKVQEILKQIQDIEKDVQTNTDKTAEETEKINDKSVPKIIDKQKATTQSITDTSKAEITNAQSINAQTAARETFWQSFRDALAGGWKAMWSQFAKQFAYDTASWVASGGKGQEPLFVTEGWGRYLSNVADEAAGAFIDSLDKRYGVDLCEPDFNIKLAIETSLASDRQPVPKVHCRFSEMTKNWEDAINNPQFSIEYNNYFRPGENDVSVFLEAKTGILNAQQQKQLESILETDDGGWKPLKSFTDYILTPGSMVRKSMENSWFEEAFKNNETFTGTIYDFIETFLNTLVAKLLNNLKSGVFDSGGQRSNGSGFGGLPNISLPRFNSLFNSQASPYQPGLGGAQARFSNLIESEVKVGGPYDILTKLRQCTDKAKTNPGPTDCVLDEQFAQAVRDQKTVGELSAAIKNRRFVPTLDVSTNPQEVFTLRNIIILRKYRIVPVGWEIAARYISQYSKQGESYTLGDLISAYNNPDGVFKSLVDPYWVLKAPELFCRREGFGANNLFAGSSNSQVSRNNYCADEQQCIKTGLDGNCAAYGYCTEEKRIWDMIGKRCEPRFNTCQTLTGRDGSAISYLANTLNYQNCNAQNVGCGWYSNLYNSVSADWRHSTVAATNGQTSQKVLRLCQQTGGCLAQGEFVSSGHNVSSNNLVIMGETCNQADGCNYNSANCIIPQGGVKCALNNCLGDDILVNGDWESGTDWNAYSWNEAYANDNNRHSRLAGQGVNGSAALMVVVSDLNQELTTDTPPITVNPNQDYQVDFSLRGQITAGSLAVRVLSGEAVLGELEFNNSINQWQNYNFKFKSAGSGDIKLAVISRSDFRGQVYFDGFSVRSLIANCQGGSVWLTLGEEDNLNSEIYFDRDVQACASDSAGCSEFIKLMAGLGSNLVANAGFEQQVNNLPAGWEIAAGGAISSQTFLGGSFSLKLDGDAPHPQIATLKTGIGLLPGHRYILSGWIYSPRSSSYAYLDLDNSNALTEDNTDVYLTGGQWQRVKMSFIAPDNGIVVKPRLVSNSSEVYFDNIKLEEVYYNIDLPSEYTAYEPSQRPREQLAYLKKAPDYYNCYKNGSSWPQDLTQLAAVLSGRDLMCQDYAQVCIPEEVGCQFYQPKNGDPAVPGIISANDLCPGECAGYQTYRQEETDFVSAQYQNFIANQIPKYCSVNFAGCDEFTNLDEVARGGEAKEYYVNLRACQKTGGNVYYSWEGSDVTGYQLKSFNLTPSNTLGGPCSNLIYNDANGQCADISNNAAEDQDLSLFLTNAGFSNLYSYFDYLKNNDPTDSSKLNQATIDKLHQFGLCVKQEVHGYYNAGSDGNNLTEDDIYIRPNADCREFYDTSGQIYYRLLSKTISISDNCHPYRRTTTQRYLTDNDVPAAEQGLVVSAESDCRTKHGYWSGQNECIYMAIPQEGRTCPANFAGCRQYTGNQGNNLRNVFFSDFASSADSWQGGVLSSEAIYPGGSSLLSQNNTLTRPVSLSVNKTYTLSFWAKGDGEFNLENIKFNNAPAESYFAENEDDNDIIPQVKITANWQRYDLGPVFVTWNANDLEIKLPGGHSLYLDNVLLKEINKNVFLVENSWFTPVACDNKIDDSTGLKAQAQPGASADCLSTGRCDWGEMLGCNAYQDEAKKDWYLKSFERLCRREAVGCQALIDTQNSESPFTEVYNVGDPSEISAPADQMVYLVTKEKTCSPEGKGCGAFGRPKINNQDEVYGYDTVYLKNLPDRYNLDLCRFNELWCEEYSSGNGLSYFKDPRGKVCEYNADQGVWRQKDSNNPCAVTEYQTIGAGIVKEKLQPLGWFNNFSAAPDPNYQGWAGLCPAAADTCSEYLDPNPTIYRNLLFNGDFSEGNSGWVVGAAAKSQDINLNSHTLYGASFVGRGYLTLTLKNCQGQVYSPDNSIDLANGNRIESLTSDRGNSGLFYIITDSESCLVTVSAVASGGNINRVKVAAAGVYYNLKNNLDYSSCGGVVNSDRGCVLFNDRSVINYSRADASRNVSYLTYDAYSTARESAPQQATEGENNSNAIIKTKPDRECYSWLYCTTYEKGDANKFEPVYGTSDQCLSLGLCSALNEKGECSRFVLNQIQDAPTETNNESVIADKSGYSISGWLFPEDKMVKGYYPMELMGQVGGSANLANGGFEITAGETVRPIGWSTVDYPDGQWANVAGYNSKINQEAGWFDYKFSVMENAKDSREGIHYLRLNAFYEAESEEMDVEPGDYYISGWIQTLDLQYPDKDKTPAAEIMYQLNDNKTGGWFQSLFNGPTVWQHPTELQSVAGLPWRFVTYKITVGPGQNKLKIKLSNYVNDAPACNGWLRYLKSGCKLSGFALFDDISVKPVLKTGNGDNDFITRTCRIYPEQDSIACKYLEEENLYYGQYGYCLTPDPQNYQQCLQWWPVDQIKGEVLEETTVGYNDRVPLYYCTKKKEINVPIIISDTMVKEFSDWPFAGLAAGGDVNLEGLRSGAQDIEFKKFEVPEEYRALFRHPYVKKFTFYGMLDAVSPEGSEPRCIFIGLPFSSEMYKDGYYFRPLDFSGLIDLGFSSLLGLNTNTSGNGGGLLPGLCAGNCGGQEKFTFVAVLQQVKTVIINSISNFIQTTITNVFGEGLFTNIINAIIDRVSDFTDSILNFGFDALGGIFDVISGRQGPNFMFNTEKDSWGGWGGIPTVIPLPEINGQCVNLLLIMPVGWNTIINFKAIQPYLELLGLQAWKEGNMDAPQTALYFGVLNNFGVKIITDEDPDFANLASDPMPELKGDILGFAWFMDITGAGGLSLTGKMKADVTIEYCDEVVQVVTPSGANKAFASRVSPGSGFIDTDLLSKSWLYHYYQPFNYTELIKNSGYQSSDYQPFGAAVPPAETADSPSNWNSKESDKLRFQPLLYEPPLPTEEPPYQARMGEVHMVLGLKQLFAKSYGVWHWQWNDSASNYKAGGHYVPGDTGLDLRLSEIISNPLGLVIGDVDSLLQSRTWDLPTNYCVNNRRSGALEDFANQVLGDSASTLPNLSDLAQADYCLVRPTVTDVKLNGQAVGNVTISGVGPVRLEFNTWVDPDQLPLTSYVIDWGDGSQTSVAGAKLRAFANGDNPFVLYHWYDYWKIRKNNIVCGTGSTATECAITVKIRVRDNWQAVNNDDQVNNGNGDIANRIKVKEK